MNIRLAPAWFPVPLCGRSRRRMAVSCACQLQSPGRLHQPDIDQNLCACHRPYGRRSAPAHAALVAAPRGSLLARQLGFAAVSMRRRCARQRPRRRYGDRALPVSSKRCSLDDFLLTNSSAFESRHDALCFDHCQTDEDFLAPSPQRSFNQLDLISDHGNQMRVRLSCSSRALCDPTLI